MFALLDRIDGEIETLPGERRHLLLRDQRSSAQMAAEPELSAFCAAVRVLQANASLAAHEALPIVSYSTAEMPPRVLRYTLEAVGAQLRVGADHRPVEPLGRMPPLAPCLDLTCAALGRAVAAEYGVALNTDGIAAVEVELASLAARDTVRGAVYWTAVAKLGCLLGEVVRNRHGGLWRLSRQRPLPIDLALHMGGHAVAINVFGKVAQRIGAPLASENSLAALLDFLAAAAQPQHAAFPHP